MLTFRKTVFLLFAFTFLFSTKGQACDSSAVALDTTMPHLNLPYPFIIENSCLDSTFTLHFATPIKCSSISTDGSNFKIITNDGWINIARKAEANCTGDSTSQILITFTDPMFYNTFAKVVILKGSNGSYIKTTCDIEWKNDSIDIMVNNCYNPQITLNAVNRISFDTVQTHWFADTTTFPSYLFTAYNIYRKTTLDTGFVFIGSSTNLMEQSFKDANLPNNYFGNISYYIGLEEINQELWQTDTLSLFVSHKNAPIIFPNPAKGVLNISLSGDGYNKIEVFDLKGSLVYILETEENLVAVYTDNWQDGLYLVKITGNNNYLEKVIVY